MPANLPPVDVFGKDYIVPLGMVTYWAARAELALAELMAIASVPPERFHDDLEPEKVKAFTRLANLSTKDLPDLLSWFDRVHDADRAFYEQIEDHLIAYLDLRDRRNRVIHDAIEPGANEDGTVEMVQVSYPRKASQASYAAASIDEISELACAFHEARSEFHGFEIGIKRRLGRP